MKFKLILAALVVISYSNIECHTLHRKKRADDDIGQLWNQLVEEARKARVAFGKYYENVQKRSTTASSNTQDNPPASEPPTTRESTAVANTPSTSPSANSTANPSTNSPTNSPPNSSANTTNPPTDNSSANGHHLEEYGEDDYDEVNLQNRFTRLAVIKKL